MGTKGTVNRMTVDEGNVCSHRWEVESETVIHKDSCSPFLFSFLFF